ncbi:TIM barrel protein [Candidatus Bathyarchaeota archaeon]|nr:TIM barrel protein [Candidatus Bathyarchaeota archaeon]
MIRLALFTVTYCGLWYKGRALSLKEQIVKAKNFGFEGISIETKRPVALPCDLSKKDRKEIKETADSYNIKICAVETMSNFARPLIEDRENNLCMVKEAIDLAADLEVDVVKVFAAWSGTSRYNGLGTYEFGRRIFEYEGNFITDTERWRLCVEGIRDVAKWAKEYGITIALQNHPPVIRYGYEDALQMVKEVNIDNVKLCLDVPLFSDQSDQYIHEAVEACKEVGIVLSHYGSLGFDELPSGEIVMYRRINYPAFIRELKRIGYSGFLVSEECSPVLERHEYQGIEAVDRHVRAALKYMRELILTDKEPRVIIKKAP